MALLHVLGWKSVYNHAQVRGLRLSMLYFDGRHHNIMTIETDPRGLLWSLRCNNFDEKIKKCPKIGEFGRFWPFLSFLTFTNQRKTRFFARFLSIQPSSSSAHARACEGSGLLYIGTHPHTHTHHRYERGSPHGGCRGVSRFSALLFFLPFLYRYISLYHYNWCR